MSIYQYILKSLWFFRKQHLAVLLGTIISTAVLTGALIIGDSVKYSLHQLLNMRLGEIEYAMPTGDRFVRAELANDISKELGIHVSPVLSVKGLAIESDSQTRANGVQVYGIDKTFSDLSEESLIDLKKDEVAISENLADKLGLAVGIEFLLRVEKANLVPVNAPFVSDEDQSIALRLTVSAVLGDDQLGRFSLRSNQVAPYNIFISREFLAEEMDLQEKANLLLANPKGKDGLTEIKLNESLAKKWQVGDAGLKFKELKEQSVYELSSDRIFIDEPIASEIQKMCLPKDALLTYFVNGIESKDGKTPYSFVTAIENEDVFSDIRTDRIHISSWLAKDLKLKVGDSLKLDYFVIGALRSLEEESNSFLVSGIFSEKTKKLDKAMMPSFPGLSNAGSCNDWDAGIPIDFTKIRDKDEAYWKKYKGTPKAMIGMSSALNMWSNKYGQYTAFRFYKEELSAHEIEVQILERLHPSMLNLNFISVRNQGENAANNMVDFGELFLSLSFFIIAAGILLTLLIYALNLENRNQETGILKGLGFSDRKILSLRFLESMPTVVLGGILGSIIGIAYNQAVIWGLNSVWQDVVRTNMIQLDVQIQTLIVGALIGMIIALLSVYWVSRKNLKRSVVGLIQNTQANSNSKKKKSFSLLIAGLTFVISILIAAYAFASSEILNAELLMSSGGLLMIACFAAFYYFLIVKDETNSRHVPSIMELAIKNAARNKGRSLTTIVLLALGCFSVMITGANRKTFVDAENSAQSGTGAYKYWIETTLPVLNDINTDEGKEKLGLTGDSIIDAVGFVQFRSLAGDDASCLNLNQVQRPRVLGFNSETFDKRSAFSFASLHESVDKNHPWLALNQDFGTDVIPAYADQTVIVWGLKKAVGDTLQYKNEFGKTIKLLLIGGLNNSIFQGNILISDQNFQANYPSVSGSKLILVDGINKNGIQIIEDQLQDYGPQIQKASERLAAFYSVENTYLNMFMLLGAFGVIIGTLGLGIVLLRNMLERKKELALLKALGFEQKSIFRLIMIENLFLLIVGLLSGALAAIVGMLPSLFSDAFSIPVGFVLQVTLAILVFALISIYIPAKLAMKQNLIESLKNE
ncbi:ABC transporter permease [Ancylomarina euxinus]|uniref:ABC transporter permease n=1 Tax=Ancylomarina euxinus TaxID=2283627 RepID=A0A425Y0T2_9BACT|nr:FtsX-like permease family protein [Ancylomarina euxinus]MCZ4693849.1 FtsX-like permease family protein [Ancylomarina euxinus]MUP15072.1 FtsX-like permease family protein [Ancylomarina euxinus]RRG21495.1 ABC transporter permease [Ancylomarina euxinus]